MRWDDPTAEGIKQTKVVGDIEDAQGGSTLVRTSTHSATVRALVPRCARGRSAGTSALEVLPEAEE